MPISNNLKASLKIGIITGASIMLCGLLTFTYIQHKAEKIQREYILDGLLRISETIASQTDPDLHEKARKERSTESDNYKKAIQPLLSAHKSLPDITFIYTFYSNGNRLFTVLDTANFPQDLKRKLEASGIMEPYSSQNPKEDTEVAAAIAAGNPYISSKPGQDRFGSFLSAFAPILKDGKPTGSAVGVDLEEKNFDVRFTPIHTAVVHSSLLTGLVAILIGTLIGWLNHRFNTASQETLSERIGRKTAEHEREMMALVAEKTTNGVVVTCPEGKIQWINASFSKLTGWTLEEVQGKKPGRILQGPDTNPQTIREIRESLLHKQTFLGEILNYTKHGTPYWIQLEIQPVEDHDGNLSHFLGIQTNITSKKQVEHTLLEAKQYAEAANKAKSEFLAVMSHEIRTPLNGVIGCCRLLKKTEHSTEQEEYLEAIMLCGTTLLETVNEILDFSKIEAGKIEIEYRDFVPFEIIQSVMEGYKLPAEKKKLTLGWNADPATQQCYHSDPTRIRQILSNLISNAIKFTPRGEVQLHASTIQNQLQVRVTDSGIGIAPNKQGKLFQPFSQADSSTTRKYGGTGLGLSISQRLAELLGGHLTLEKSNPEGSTFLLTLPLYPPKLLPEEQKNQIVRSGKILIAEDNHINQMLLTRILSKKNHQAESCWNGVECLEKCQENAYDLIFMDVHMPEMDGIEATEKLRQLGITIPIIAVTANAQKEDLDTCLKAGMNGFMTKPFSEERLDEILSEFLPHAKT